jgi:hypothetical protein
MSTEGNVLSEGLSEAELAYFSSKGEKTEGLASEPTPEPAPTVETAPEPSTEPPVGEVDDEEGIYLDENGKARSVLTGKFVPHAALHKEREKRKSVESERDTYKDKIARAEERLAILNEVLSQNQPKAQTQQEAPAGPPNPEEDIFGFVKHLAAKEEQRSQELEQMKRQQAVQQVRNAYREDALAFAKEVPDFPDAYRHLAQSMAAELKVMGYPDNEIQQRLIAEEERVVMEAMQRRIRPAQVVYERARARGFTQPQPQAAQPQQNGGQKLQTIERAKQTQRTLSGAGGSSGEGLTVDALAAMSDDEFAAVAAKLGKSKMKGYLGG